MQHAASDDRAPAVGARVVDARAVRGLARPGQVEQQPDERLEQRAGARHHGVDEADRRAAEAGRVVLLRQREAHDLRRAAESRSGSTGRRARTPAGRGHRRALPAPRSRSASPASMGGRRRPMRSDSQPKNGAPTPQPTNSMRRQRRGERARQAVGGLQERHAPQAGEAEQRRGRAEPGQRDQPRLRMASDDAEPRQHVGDAAAAAPPVAHGRPGRHETAPRRRRRAAAWSCASRKPRRRGAAVPGRARRLPCPSPSPAPRAWRSGRG